MQLLNILVILAVNLHSLCYCFPSKTEEKKISSENEISSEKKNISESLFSETVLWPEEDRNETKGPERTEGPDYFFHSGKIFI